MTVPLREPLFLRGRTSVLQRAVIMSLVLAGLTAAAAWIVAVIAVVSRPLVGSPVAMYFVVPAAWAVTSALLVYGPLHRWNQRPPSWTLAALPVGFVLMFFFTYWMRNGPRHLRPEIHLTLGFFGVLAGSGLLLVRSHRLHVLAYLVSICGAVLPALVILLIKSPTSITIPGFTQTMSQGVVYAILFGTWFGAPTIPWSIPFWWPLVSDTQPAEPK